MAWIKGTEEQTFEVNVPLKQVRAVMGNPGVFQKCFAELDSAEELEPMLWRFTLQEKAERGVRFKPDYQVQYESQQEGLSWEPVRGNLRTEGVARWRALDDERTEIYYRETIAVDLPIPRILAKIFGLIVAREIRQDVGAYLDNMREFLRAERPL